MKALGANRGSSGGGAFRARSSRTSAPFPQEPNAYASAPPFGSCGKGFEVREDLYRSSIESTPGASYPV